MKKGMMMLAVLLAAGVATAAIYSEDFTADPGLINVADNAGFTPTTYAYGSWLKTGAQVWTNGALQIASHSNGGTRGAGISLASSNFAAGDYTISFDITDRSASGLLGFAVYEMTYGGTTDYRLDFVNATGSYVLPRTGAPDNARTTILDPAQYTTLGTQSFNVTLSGTNDVIVMFSGISATGSTQTSDVDNISITAIPEPATIGLMAIAAGGIFAFRRKRI